MNCKINQESLSQWIDGELPPANEAEVFAHLSACGDCRVFFNNLRSLQQEILSTRITQVPAALDQRILTNNNMVKKPLSYIFNQHPAQKYSYRVLGFAVLLSVFITSVVSFVLHRSTQPQQTIVCLTPLPEVEVNGYVVVAPSSTKGINQ